MLNNTIYINLYEKGNNKYRGEFDGKYFYIFPSSRDDNTISDIAYRLLVFNNKDSFDKRLAGEKVDADMVASIKEKENENETWLGGMLFDNKNKIAYYINLGDNTFKYIGKNSDKCLLLTETVYKESRDNMDKYFDYGKITGLSDI